MSDDRAEPGTSSRAAAHVVVFDFDGTLVSRDSFLDFALRYGARRPLRWLLVIALLPLVLPLAVRSFQRSAALLLWALTLGTSTHSFARALHRYAKQTLPSYANDAIFGELDAQLQAGHRVVIATGSMPLLVRGLFRARKLPLVPIVGSRLRRRWGGLVTETHCIGKTKVRELQRKLGIVEWSAVYTDSFADRSLLRGARSITLVAPSTRTLRRTQRLIDGTTVLRVLRRG
ncbi:MAG TPA: HAD family hydrolase [Polyangiaceae bacterium]|jgi:phosphatidylglycerophosphatase C|nr:HAD family hydrolase [Polyangiaceae bacterium]